MDPPGASLGRSEFSQVLIITQILETSFGRRLSLPGRTEFFESGGSTGDGGSSITHPGKEGKGPSGYSAFWAVRITKGNRVQEEK